MNRNSITGRFVETYPRKDFVAALRELNGAAGTTDIATEVGCTQDAAYKKLMKMREDEQVETQQVGRSFLWSLTDDDNSDENA